MTVVGIDVSSRRIDLAWLQHDRPCRWHQYLGGGKHDDELIDRLRRIHLQWPCDEDGTPGADVQEVAIEYPWARGNGVPALWATVGVVTRQVPYWARVSWPTPGELRAAIGARNTKQSAHDAIRFWSSGAVTGESFTDDWDEHELDALVACVGWTRILNQQDTCTP